MSTAIEHGSRSMNEPGNETETAQVLYERIRRDSGYRMSPYRTVNFIARMMHRDPFVVLNAIGPVKVAKDDEEFQP